MYLFLLESWLFSWYGNLYLWSIKQCCEILSDDIQCLCFFCNSCFSRTVVACSDSRFSIRFWILLGLEIFENTGILNLFFSELWSWNSAWCATAKVAMVTPHGIICKINKKKQETIISEEIKKESKWKMLNSVLYY